MTRLRALSMLEAVLVLALLAAALAGAIALYQGTRASLAQGALAAELARLVSGLHAYQRLVGSLRYLNDLTLPARSTDTAGARLDAAGVLPGPFTADAPALRLPSGWPVLVRPGLPADTVVGVRGPRQAVIVVGDAARPVDSVDVCTLLLTTPLRGRLGVQISQASTTASTAATLSAPAAAG